MRFREMVINRAVDKHFAAKAQERSDVLNLAEMEAAARLAVDRAYHRGYDAGWHKGYAQGQEDVAVTFS